MPFPKKVQILSSVFWPFIKRPYLFVKIFLFFFSRSYVRFLYLVFISNFFKRYIEPNKQNKTLSGVAVNVLAWAAKEALKKIKRYWLTFRLSVEENSYKRIIYIYLNLYLYRFYNPSFLLDSPFAISAPHSSPVSWNHKRNISLV